MKRCLLLFFLAPLLGKAQLSSSSYQVLNLPTTAKDALWQKMSISLIDSGFTQVSSNPVFLQKSHAKSVSAAYGAYIADIRSSYLNYACPIGKSAIIMPSIQYLHAGKFLETDEYGNTLRTFSGSDLILSAAYANAWKKHFRVAAQLKGLYSQYLTYNSWAISSDYYLYYSKNPTRYGMTLAVLNLGMPINGFTSLREPLPLNIQWNASFRLAHSPLIINTSYNYLNQWDLNYDLKYITQDPFTGLESENTMTFSNLMKHINLGVEFVPSKKIRFGLSYDFKRRSELKHSLYGKMAGISMGLGFKAKKWEIDYTLMGNGVSLFSNFITITTQIPSSFKK